MIPASHRYINLLDGHYQTRDNNALQEHLIKELRAMSLNAKENQAIGDLKKSILSVHPDARFILFGSKARGGSNPESDIDILVIIGQPLSTTIERKIFDLGFEVGLRHDVIFGIVVENTKAMNSLLFKAMPFYRNIQREGIAL